MTHQHQHQHDHHHHHHHAPANYNLAFAIGIGLNVVYIIVEAVFGVVANSLALLADAGHNLSDVLGLLLAWGASYLTQIKPSQRRTYGWRSASIFAALINGIILLVAVGGIVWEAIHRFGQPEPSTGTEIMWVAGIGVVINAVTAFLFFGGRKGDLNIKGAFLHMAADAVVSAGVVIAGLAIYATGLEWIDPVTSLVVALVILLSTWSLLTDSANLALQAVPHGIEIQEVKDYLLELPNVEHVHDLHVWAMSTTETALTVHLVKSRVENDDALLAEAGKGLHDRFGVEHVTIQIERSAEAASCRQASDDAI